MDKFARNLDWNLLYTFMVIVQEQKLTIAAERLFVTQPAVSLALKRLEEYLGVQLLRRGRSNLEMTVAGEAIYKEACKIYASISRMPIALEHAPKSVAGRVSIATISQVMSDELDNTLSDFFANHPKAELTIQVMTTAEIIRAVELGRVTLGVCDGIIPDSLIKRLLRQEDFALFCGATHPLFGKENLSLEALRGHPFVNFTADVLGGQHMGNVTALRAKASIGQSVRGQSSNVNELRRMIEFGLGVGFLPVHLAEPFERAERLWRLPPYDDLPSAEIYLICNDSTKFSPAEGVFLSQLMELDL
jgi:DNA-binding transcriptional LysR family regulator